MGLHPAVAGLDGEVAAHALGGEQIVPVFFAVGQAVLEVEGARAEDAATVRAAEALGVELLAHGVQAVSFDSLAALIADGREVLFVADLAVQASLLLHEAHVDQRLLALLRGAHEAAGAPGLAQGTHEGAPDLSHAVGADGDPGGHCLVHHAPAAAGGGAAAGLGAFATSSRGAAQAGHTSHATLTTHASQARDG